MNGILFNNANVFDGSGSASFKGAVLVQGQHITEVFRVDDLLPSSLDIRVIDATHHTLMPGLVEAHAHLTWPSSVERVINAMKLPPEEHLLVTAQNARITLDHGYTSAYSAGSLGERFEPALKQMIDAGHLPGPRLRASALETGMDGVMGVPASHDAAHQRDLPGLRSYVQRMKDLGCDTIKFLLSSDEAFAVGGAQQLLYTEDETQAIGAAARGCGIWLACHAQSAEAIKRAVRAGFRAIYHCTYADDEALDLLQEHRDTVFIAPAPGLLWARCNEAQAFGIGPAEAARMGATSGLELMQDIVPKLRRRGIRVLPGGDYGFPYNPIGRNARDLELFVKLFGFTPREALSAATAQGGELMDMPVGRIAKGMLADLLLVDGDPTVDISQLQDKSRLRVIMKGGALYKCDAALAAWPEAENERA